jgi:hypothetical protein
MLYLQLGGLCKAYELGWSAATRVMLIITDAPCHGTKYHTLKREEDVYPDGDPSGLSPEEMVR